MYDVWRTLRRGSRYMTFALIVLAVAFAAMLISRIIGIVSACFM